MCTLDTLYSTMAETAVVRRAAVRACLGNEPTFQHADQLTRLLSRISDWPKDGGRTVLRAGDVVVQTPLDFERRELRRDIELLRHGEEALLTMVSDENPRFLPEVAFVSSRLRTHFPIPGPVSRSAGEDQANRGSANGGPAGTKPPVYAFITDRDGTVVNYCSRYRASVQPAYNALFLARFAGAAAGHSVILSSAPLESGGLVDVSTVPDDLFVYAGSKGREYRAPGGNSGRLAIPAEQQLLLDRFNAALQRLLRTEEFRIFTLIGSSLQFKFGQTTVARQDVEQSIPVERSQRLLRAVTELVGKTDPEGRTMQIEDTGMDIEIILTLDAERDAKDGEPNGVRGAVKDFDKGDGIAYLESQLNLNLAAGANLVCGDTASDLPMAEAVGRRSSGSLALFVGADDALRQTAERKCPSICFVSCPDVLVFALNRYATEAERVSCRAPETREQTER